jgi:hypothetical protein
MSFRLKRFLPKLLDGLRHSERPVFPEQSLRKADAECFALMREHKILVAAGLREIVNHEVHGAMDVIWVEGKPFLTDPEAPCRELVEIDTEDLRLSAFCHKSMMRWIAATNDMDGESATQGALWTIGTSRISGARCHVLYYSGKQNWQQLVLAIRHSEFAEAPSNMPKLLITPIAIPLPATELQRLDTLNIQIEPLYKLAGTKSIDLQLASIQMASSADVCVFRRAGDSWEIGFQTNRPLLIPNKSGMSEIWLLLRNPGKEFKAYEITNELHGLDQKHEPVRSAGTTPRSAATPEAKNKINELLRAIEHAKDDGNEIELKYAEEDLSTLLGQLGVRDSYRGLVQRENNDFQKERESMAKAIKRSIANMEAVKAGDLQKHLKQHIKTGDVFSYAPPEIPRWQTQ